MKKSLKRTAIAAAVGASLALVGGLAAAGNQYVLVWTGDKGGWEPVNDTLLPGPGAHNDPLLNKKTDPNYEKNGKGVASFLRTGDPNDLASDFIAVVDAKPAHVYKYGAVVNTATMPFVLNAHVLAQVAFGLEVGDVGDVGLTPSVPDATTKGLFEDGLPSAIANEAHHTNAFLEETNDGRKLMWAGGLISGNIFGCDVTNPMNIRPIHNTIVSGDMKGAVVRYNANGPDATDPKYKNTCGLAVSGGFGGTNYLTVADDFVSIGDNLLAGSFLGTKENFQGTFNAGNGFAPTLPPSLTTPGGVVVFNHDGTLVKEFSAVLNSPGPIRHKPRWQCIPCAVLGEDITTPQDTNNQANPHGIFARPDLNTLVTSDYGDAVSLALSGQTPLGLFDETAADTQAQGLDSTVRFWDIAKMKSMSGMGGDDYRPEDIAQVPDGPRNEGREGGMTDAGVSIGSSSVTMDEFVGLMAAWKTNCTGGPSDDPGCKGKQHKGGFVASMCGGTLFYIEDMTTWQNGQTPNIHAVYDTGPCTGVSVFFLTQDDTYLIAPISGIITPGQPLYNRDYPFEHSRRVVAWDVRPLVNDTDGIQCDYPSASTNTYSDAKGFAHRFDGSATTIYAGARNNGASDCPVIASRVILDNLDNLMGAGGPHFTLPNPADNRVVSSLYFFDLREFALPQPVGSLPGSGSIGDDRVCMFTFKKRLKKGIGKARLRSDRRFGLYSDVPSWGPEGQRYGPHFYFTYYDGCVDFDRKSWPHGDSGHGTPHGMAWWTS
ncbi:MAG TPA: hypothetical protein ENK49_14385 [Gammaproteobacteria bacterium]|nr:hypothetical protein [Gammaproteobacteria bacterium]